MNKDGSMARVPDLIKVAKKFDLKIISIEDLVAYRMEHASLIEKEEDFEINTRFGKFRLRAYKQTTNNNIHIALTKGSWDKGDAVLTRINSKSVQNDILGTLTTDTDASLSKMFEIINNDGMGAIIFISPELKAINTLKRLKILRKNQAKNKVTKAPILNMDDRDFGIGAQILHDLDITNLKLITNTKETRRVQGKQSRTGYTTIESSKHFFVNDIEHPYNETNRFDWMRGYHVGGRSLTWGRQSYRLTDFDFEANVKEGMRAPFLIQKLKKIYRVQSRYCFARCQNRR